MIDGGEMIMLEQMGKVMKLLRNNKNLSLKKESELLGINQNTLACYEENPENMSISLFNKFLKIHGISNEIFFKMVDDNSLKNR